MKWDLYGAVCLERKPVVMKPLTEKELKVAEILSELEVEGSFKSDHEIKAEDDVERAKEIKSSKKLLDLNIVLRQTAHEYEEIANKEFSAFQPQPILTSDDKKKNTKSLNRELCSHLTLAIKDKMGDESVWVLPHGIRKDGETMRETAERVLREKCGDGLNVMFLGNAPCACFKTKYPKKYRTASLGAKIFFYKAVYLSGNVSNDADYQWITRKDLRSVITWNNYCNFISKFLIDEGNDFNENFKRLRGRSRI